MQKMIGDGFHWFLGLVESRRGIKVADVDGLIQGRIFSGREAHSGKLADEIGGEAEAVRWLEKKRGIKPDLKVVDWKPKARAVGACLVGFTIGALFGATAGRCLQN